MLTLPDKDVFSTGEMATICHMTKHTIVTAIERGELKASQTPGGHNRILRNDAIVFMRRCNLLAPETQKKILVVDDEEVVRLLLSQIFIEDGFEIHHAATGYEAGKMVERLHPDLIILDILLPDIDGRQVCRHIREEDFGKRCKVLALTVLNSEEDVRDIYDAGINDYLPKPFSIDGVRDKVHALMGVKT